MSMNQICTERWFRMFRWTIVALVLSLVSFAQEPDEKRLTDRLLSKTELTAVVQAVEDEIYDYGYQTKFSYVGDAPDGLTRVPIYISPKTDKDSVGEIIYKYMPYGEVSRRFLLRQDGLVILFGDPELGFPPQLPDTNTLYLNDEDVCRLKLKWTKTYFTVDPKATTDRIKLASSRQKERIRFSKMEDVKQAGGPVMK